MHGLQLLLTATLCLSVAGCADARASGAGRAGEDLARVEWQVSQVVEPAKTGTKTETKTWTPPPEVDARLRFDGQGGFSAEACNHLSGKVAIDGSVLRFSGGVNTDMACTTEPLRSIEAAFQAVVGGQARWAIDGGQLRLDTASGWGLRLRVSESIYPGRDVRALLEGPRDGHEFRLSWRDCGGEICLRWDQRDAPGKPWGTAESAWSKPSSEQMVDAVGDDLFLAGVVPPDTVRVVYQRPGGRSATELGLFDIPGVPMGRVFAGFVVEPVAGSEWIAFDDHGRVLMRRGDLPTPPLPWS
jgi:heat shock protein HslJ